VNQEKGKLDYLLYQLVLAYLIIPRLVGFEPFTTVDAANSTPLLLRGWGMKGKKRAAFTNKKTAS
jgi:hypothetical protein